MLSASIPGRGDLFGDLFVAAEKRPVGPICVGGRCSRAQEGSEVALGCLRMRQVVV